MNLDIDDVFDAQKKIFTKATGFEPRFKVHGGSVAENLALQNVQARTRMVTAYEFSQMLPTVVSSKICQIKISPTKRLLIDLQRKRNGGGNLLVLGSSNADEAIRGYYTRYDW